MSINLVLVLTFAVAMAAGFSVAALRLWRDVERARVSIWLRSIQIGVDTCAAGARNLTTDDEWLLTVLRQNLLDHLVRRDLRTTLGDLLHISKPSKDRKMFIRRLTRASKQTHYNELRGALDELNTAAIYLACVNSRPIAMLCAVLRYHATRLERAVVARICPPLNGHGLHLARPA